MADINNPVNENCKKLPEESLENVVGGTDETEGGASNPGSYGQYPPHHPLPYPSPAGPTGQYPPHHPLPYPGPAGSH